MKYIKMENQLYKITDETDYSITYENSQCVGCLCKDAYKDKLQLADTIEELCDEFVVIYDFLRVEHTVCHSFASALALSEERNNSIIYGAIWTEWGLKFVARMHSKGELELL